MVHRSPDLGLIRTFLTAEEVETLKEAHSAPFDAYERLPRTENASTPSSVGSDSESDASSDSDLPIRSWLVSRDRTTGTRVLSDINARALHVAASSFGFDGPQTPRRPRTFSRRRRRRPPWGAALDAESPSLVEEWLMRRPSEAGADAFSRAQATRRASRAGSFPCTTAEARRGGRRRRRGV